MPNFEEIWPSNKDKDAKYKRRLIGMEYYMDAMEHHGLKGHLPQPENFTTCGKLGIEINQYNCPIEVRVLISLVYFMNRGLLLEILKIVACFNNINGNFIRSFI